MNRSGFLLFTGCLLNWVYLSYSGEATNLDFIERIDKNSADSIQKGEIDRNRLYLDSVLLEQMMLEAERVSPKAAKVNYLNLRNARKEGSLDKTSNTIFTSGQLSAGSGSAANGEEPYSVNNMMSALPSQTEYDALIDFYQAMDGTNWFNNTGWNTADPNVLQDVSSFHGVTLDENGHVKWLIFWQNNLNGTIPESFGNLVYLEHIQLVRNPYIGQLPQSIGNLDKVVELLLYANNMTGTIPNTIGNMTALENVHLYINNLTGSIPSSLTSLPNLRFFSVYDNDLAGTLPADLGNLDKLTHLYINGNAISGAIPSTIGEMSSMKELYLYSNQLSGSIPPSIGNLSGLTRLYLNQNQLSGALPTSLGNLANLEFFWIQDNDITGQIPSEMGGLQVLDSFLAYRNELSGNLPSSLGNIASLRQLRLDENQLDGSIPSSYGDLVNINALTLNNNKLTGSIPGSFCSFVNISNLGLHNNKLEGDIPNCLFDKNILQFTTRYNYYNFEDLAYAKSKVNDYYLYAPQLLKFVDTVYMQPSASMDLSVNDGNYQGSPSIYRWKKNGTWVHNASPDYQVLSITCNTSACEGLYYLEIINPDFIGPKLYGDVFYVKLVPVLNRTICSSNELNEALELYM